MLIFVTHEHIDLMHSQTNVNESNTQCVRYVIYIREKHWPGNALLRWKDSNVINMRHNAQLL